MKLKSAPVKCSVFAMLTLLILGGLRLTPLADAIKVQITNRFVFWARAKAHRQSLDPRLKIFSFDDYTVAGLGALDIPLSDWAAVLEALDRRHPRAIVIDKLFDKDYPVSDVDGFARRVGQLTTPIYIIGFVTDKAIPLRETVALSRPEFALKPRLDAGMPPAWLRHDEPGYVYSARGAIAGAVKGIGHAIYGGDGYVRPFVSVAAGVAVPHAALLAARQVRVVDDGMVVDGVRAPTDETGRLLVDMLPMEEFNKVSLSMKPLVLRARAGHDIPVVAHDDIVLILPAMYTGNTDWRETPFGSVPGGFILGAFINSTLTGHWLRETADHGVLLLGACMVGALLGLTLPPVALWTATVGLVVATVAGGLALFFLSGVTFDWIFPLIGLGTVVSGIFSIRIGEAELLKQRMASELATARLVQEAFVPIEAIATDYLRIKGVYQPASECGGDWWGHFSPKPGVDVILIGDAIGHGASAALMTAAAFSAFNIIGAGSGRAERPWPSPAGMLKMLDGVLRNVKSELAVMTFFAIEIDSTRGLATFANAGHPFPFLLPASARTPSQPPGKPVVTLRNRGMPLGNAGDFVVEEKTTPVGPGDRIVLLTDGLYENRGPRNAGWGLPNLRAHLNANANQDAERLLADTVAAYRGHVGEATPEDDITLVVVELLPGPAEAPADT